MSGAACAFPCVPTVVAVVVCVVVIEARLHFTRLETTVSVDAIHAHRYYPTCIWGCGMREGVQTDVR